MTLQQRTRILDGKATAAAVREEVRAAALDLVARHGTPPGLAVVLVGEDPASQVYVRNKDRAAAEAGFAVRTVRLAATVAQGELEARLDELQGDPGVHGILVQLPLPRSLDADRLLARLDPALDVDGLTPASVAAYVMGRPGLRPCTPAGCIELCDRHDIPLEGRHVVVVGRSLLVGKPIVHLALARNATVTVCHSRTRDLADHCRRADVLVAAVGIPRLVQGDWIRPGATVIDVGDQSRARRPAGRRRRLRGRRAAGRSDHSGSRGRRTDDGRDAPAEHPGGRALPHGAARLSPVRSPR